MKKLNLYYLETDKGCGIRSASSLKQAHKEALKAVGTEGFERIRRATKEDIDNVSAMGGYIPTL